MAKEVEDAPNNHEEGKRQVLGSGGCNWDWSHKLDRLCDGVTQASTDNDAGTGQE